MADYKHGVYVSEQATSLSAPITGSAGLIVVVGTAPINTLADPSAAVNTPLLANTYAEAVSQVGYSTDFDSYTICEAISAAFNVIGVAPIVMINVLDPAKHSAALETESATVSNLTAKIDETGILLDELEIKNGDAALVKDTDYTTSWNDDGTLNIILISGGAGASATSLTVSGKKLDASKVTKTDIVGAVDTATGAESGLEVLRQVYPKLSVVPGIVIAPKFSKDATVAAAMQSKVQSINECFNAMAYIDIDSSSTGATKYTDVKAQKTKQALTSTFAYAVWLKAKVGELIYCGATIAAAQTAYIDAANSDVPYVSPSNKSLTISAACLDDGTEVLLDRAQANTVNSYGVATFINNEGFRLWGNNTCAYPSSTDPKDRWITGRRFFNWAGNDFIRSYAKDVDDPLNPRKIDAIVDAENAKGNGLVSMGACARYELKYAADENTAEDLLNGVVKFHQYMSPFQPMEAIENTLEFDPYALQNAFN